MSGSDPSDDDKGFLARWSQRKQQAKQPEAEPKPEAPSDSTSARSAPAAEAAAAQEFDLSSLPKLEDLTGTSDITAFLRKGVPEQLRNEALRKSWALDPAIRNYVNPAMEYAYDWNTPGGVPGSGDLGPGIDVARLVSQIMGSGPAEAPPAAADPAATPTGDLAQSSRHDAAQIQAPQLPTQTVSLGDSTDAAASAAAADDRIGAARAPNAGLTEDPVAPQKAVRRHGSAKPTI